MKFPNFLEDAFTDGFTRKDADNDVFVFRKYTLGKIKITNGFIMAFDPLCMYFEEPFTAQFPIGEFDIELAIATINNDDRRNGLARIRFSDTQPAKWVYAVTEGQNPEDLEGDEYFGYGVDSGIGAFMDSAVYPEYDELFKNDEAFGKLTEQLDANYEDTLTSLIWEGKAGNGAIFTTGYGDGMYGSYIGYDLAGKICRLVTDFGLLEW